MTWTDGVQRRVLANGLTLVAQRHALAPVVAVVTHVQAGYFDEPDAWVGIAHVLEHMYFKGTARRGPGDVARETQLLGGYINAGTIYDKTVYYTVLPSAGDGLARALDIQADALMHTALDPEELRRELEVIIQEAKRKLDTPSAVASETLYARLFRVHRMRRWRIGTEEELRRLTHADVRAYHATRYVPGRVIVGIAGDVDPARALDAAAALYESWDAPTPPVEGSPAEPDDRAAGLALLHGDVERPLAELGWRTVGTLDADAAALDVAAVVLGSGQGSQLYGRLRRPGLAASAGATHYTPTEIGVFEVGMESDGDRLERALETALDAVDRLSADGPTPDEMARAHALMDAQWAKRLEGAEGRAAALCESQALGGVEVLDELYRRERAVRAEDVRAVAARYLTPTSAVGVLYLPDGTEAPVADRWPPLRRVAVAPAARGDALQAEPTPAAPPLRRRDRGDAQHLVFDGADLLLQARRGSGLVTLLLHFPGVPLAEDAATAGLSWLLARTALRGAGALDGSGLAQAAEGLGGGIGPSVGTESMGWGMTVRASEVSRAATLLQLVARAATLDPQEVLVERDLQASDARRARDDMFRYPLQGVLAQAFPTHAYGRRRLGEPERIATFAPEDVRRWSDGVRSSRAAVIAVGDLDPEAIGALAPLLAWQPHAPAPIGDVGPPVWHGGRGEERRRREQTALAMAYPTGPYASADRYPLIVLAALLSGLAGRLFEELREKRSLAYTVAAMPWLAREAGALLCYIATSPERETEARDAMRDELERVVTVPPDDAELARARNYAAGSVEVRRQTGRAVAAELLEAWVYGGLDDLPRTAHRLRAVTVDEVVRVAATVLREESRAEYVVRGGAAD